MERVLNLRKNDSLDNRTQVWAVSSGKGGVGKSFISTSLSICLSKMGYSCLIVDLDPSGANIHTALGVPPSVKNLRHWLDGESGLLDIISPTHIPRLSFIQGLWDNWSPAELPSEKSVQLITELRKLKVDFIILDLGPGATESQLTVFSNVDERILVSSPEPTSIEKTYRFIEAALCYKLKDAAQPEAFTQLLAVLREHRARNEKKFFSFRKHINGHEGFLVDHFEQLNDVPVKLIINMARNDKDVQLGYSMKSVCKKFFDLPIEYLGAIDFDNAVWQSVRNGEPVLLAQPFTPLTGQFLIICKQLIAQEEIRAVG